MLANCSINNYVITLLKAKMENENIFKKPARNLGNMIDQISKDELTDLQNVQISKYHVFTNDTLMVNEEYKVPNYVCNSREKESLDYLLWTKKLHRCELDPLDVLRQFAERCLHHLLH